MAADGGRGVLAAELTALRTLAGLTQRGLAARTGLSQAAVYRIENSRAAAPPSLEQVVAWLDATGAGSEQRQRVLSLVERAHRDTRSWRDTLGAVGHAQEEMRQREAGARLIRVFEPLVIPGLLQVARYAQRIFELGRTTNVSAALAIRLERQGLLYEPDRRFEFILGERALTWSPGGDALAGQLDRLLSVGGLDSVELAVLPSDAAVLVWHGFVALESAEGETYISAELNHGLATMADAESVEMYRALWDQLWKAAVTRDDARELLARVAADYRQMGEV